MRVLAIDPGERVGWAHGILTPPNAVGPGVEITGQGVSPLKDFALKLHEVFGEYDVVVYETWRLYPGIAKSMVGNDMQPSQLVGMIRLCGWLNPGTKLVSQGANIKKTALKTMPDWLKERMSQSSEQHDQDALMHLWFFHWERRINANKEVAR